MKPTIFALPLLALLGWGCRAGGQSARIEFQSIDRVQVQDEFWRPKFEQWRTVTAIDVLDKFEGLHAPEGEERAKLDAMRNFDLVAEGKRDFGRHAGPPWYDGLVYETIRGLSDFLLLYPDPQLEARIDGYVDRIALAQANEPDGFINTWTQLMESSHRWGENGGMLRWQHDVYNAGMLVEAGVHYYRATGKAKLLGVATRMADMMFAVIGPEPKKNVVAAHSGPEEALVKLYTLYRDDPQAKAAVGLPVEENNYMALAEFLIENRGHHVGFPLWGTWGGREAEKWIREAKYDDPKYGTHRRPTWGDYAQDSIPVFQQQTIEGHAVRATLLATGIATAALENLSPDYASTATRLWDNMAGRRMFITGGVGAVHFDEKFGPDYFLPTDAYLETCAAVGAGFFSQRMNQLTGHGKYIDELERTLYNGVLTGISLSGVNYTYQNPLNADRHGRWEWHGCPCCPPMFLKIMAAIPGFIYSHRGDELFVNLFVGSKTQFDLDGRSVSLAQQTRYPWEGKVAISVDPEREETFTLNVRIPGWATGEENPYGLYSSDLKEPASLKVNGQDVPIISTDGYAAIRRKWSKGDVVELTLPMQPRVVTADEHVEQLRGMVAIASGPLVYCLEDYDNGQLADLKIDASQKMSVVFRPEVMNGVNVVEGRGVNAAGEPTAFSAVPYYAAGNRETGKPYKVWASTK